VTRTVAEVLVGPGTMYTADENEPIPSDPATAPGANWLEIGYSEAGWSFVADRTFERVRAAEEIDPLKTFKTEQELHIRGTSLQASLANLRLALGGGAIVSDAGPPETDTYTPPGSDEFTAWACLLRVQAPQTATAGTEMRDFYFPKVISIGAIDMPHDKAPQVSVIAMDFEANKPDTGDIFTIVELT